MNAKRQPQKKLNKRQLNRQKKAAEPFILLDSDPTNFGKLKDTKIRIKRKSKFNSHRLNLIKSLTKRKPSAIIGLSKKLKRKDDKMANGKNKKANKSNAPKSAAWLVEASIRAFTGWVLLSNFDHFVTTAVAFYQLGTAGVIVVYHFINAHK